MRLAVVAVLATLIVSAGCQAGYKSVAGGATSPSGYGRGVTRSLKFADEGLLLSRLGLGFLAVGAAAGSIENAKSESTAATYGDRTVVTTESSATINTGTLNAAGKIADAANGPRSSLSGKSGGLAARLEIASRDLGGDTSGWQYDMGFNLRVPTRIAGRNTLLRSYFGVGYGNFTFHERVMTATDRGPPKFGDADYGFGGIYIRGGVFVLSDFRRVRDFKSIKGAETYAVLNANARGASFVGLGQRFQWSLGFIEAEVLVNGMSRDDRSYALEVGLGF